jgi:hypothetical protein
MMIGGEHYFRSLCAVPGSMGHVLHKNVGVPSFFATGRDALFTLLRSLPLHTIYLPDLMCISVYEACRAAGKQVKTYRVSSDLITCDVPPQGNRRQEGLLVMHYFGIRNSGLVAEAKRKGMHVISDVTHMLFNERQLAAISDQSDYLIASLRKSGPFPDGGFISSKYHSVAAPSMPIRMDFYSLRAAGLLSRAFSAAEDFIDDENFVLLRRAEEIIDQSEPGDYQCSYLSRRLLYTVDMQDSVRKMKNNIAVLISALNGLCKSVNTADAPSPYFFCLFEDREDRDKVRSRLAGERIFCPIHWDTSQMPESSPLSEVSLSVPCDSRYDETEMQRIANIVRSCLKP